MHQLREFDARVPFTMPAFFGNTYTTFVECRMTECAHCGVLYMKHPASGEWMPHDGAVCPQHDPYVLRLRGLA